MQLYFMIFLSAQTHTNSPHYIRHSVTMAPEPKPFQISVPEKALQSLKNKLLSSTYFEEVEFADDWDYGAPMRDVKRLARYWADGFDWRAQEAKINSTLPQFTTTVHVDKFGDLEMHFVHQKSDNPKSIPLLFCHGCETLSPFYIILRCLANTHDSKGLEVFSR